MRGWTLFPVIEEDVTDDNFDELFGFGVFFFPSPSGQVKPFLANELWKWLKDQQCSHDWRVEGLS